jgi:hypothetical protein
MGTPRPPRPNNVVALSQYRARLGRGRRLRRADALLEAPDLEAAVRALPGDELYYVLHEIGLGEGAELLAAATAEQLAVVLDFALWERDQVNPAALGEWLQAISEVPFERVGRWLTGIDSELVGLILRHGARIIDLTQEEPPDEPEGIFWPTPDGFFLLDVRVTAVVEGGPDPARALIRIVDAFYRWDKSAARRIIVGAIGELDAELEESAYRWRQARMADLGFADYYEALEVYRELDPASVKIGDAAGRTRTIVDSGSSPRMTDGEAALRVPTALAERMGNTDGSPFARAAQKLTTGDELDDLRFALVALTNRVLAADRIAPGDDEAVAAVLDRLVATLDLAIERLAQGDDERGAKALRTIPLARLFRLGVSLCGKVKRLALAVRREGPFGRRAFALAETDDATVLEAVTRLRPMFPRLLDDPPMNGERPFRSLGDLARAGAAIEQAAAAQAMVHSLGVTAPDVAAGGTAFAGTGMDEAGLDLGTLARTALVARLLAGGETKQASRPAKFQALTPAEVKAFEAMLKPGRTKATAPKLTAALEKNARAILAAAAPPPLRAAAATVAARWVADLAPLEPVLVRAPAKPRRR